MITTQQLALLIHQKIDQQIIEFQRFLAKPEIFFHPSLLQLLSDLIYSQNHTHNHKKLAATSLQFIFKKRIDQNYREYTQKCWNQYFQIFLSQKQSIPQWQYIALTKHALQYLLEQLDEDAVSKSLDKYQTSSFYGKLLLMESFKQHQQISPDNQFAFFRQTIENFISSSLEFLFYAHNKQRFDLRLLMAENDLMMTLFQWLAVIKMNNQQRYLDMLDNLAKNDQIARIIKQELQFRIQLVQNNYHYKKSQDIFSIQGIDKINSHSQKNELILQLEINIKAYALSCLDILCKSFFYISTMEDFDKFSVLGLLESLTQTLIDQLHNNSLLKQKYLTDQESNLHSAFQSFLISAFSLLRRSANFIFLMQILQQNKDKILYSIFFTYLQTTSEQLQAYDCDGEQFVQLSAHVMEQEAEKGFDTPKQACAAFLQDYLKLVNDAQIQYIEFLGMLLRYRIFKEQTEQISNFKYLNYQIPSLELIYLILTRIYIFQDKGNEMLLNVIYENFIKPEFVFTFKKIDKTRFIIFLMYSYGQYFADNLNQGGRYLNFSLQSKNQNDSQLCACMDLLQNAFESGVSFQVWQYLMENIVSFKEIKQFRLIRYVVSSYLRQIDLNVIRIAEVIQKISLRIERQYEQNRENLEQKNGDSAIFYECLNILQIIASNKEAMTKYSKLSSNLLRPINYFTEPQVQIQNLIFNTHIIIILNKILDVQQIIPIQFKQYLPALNRIIASNKAYDQLLQTYYLILLKGNNAFQSNPQFLLQIQNLIQQNMLNNTIRNSKLVIQSSFLLQTLHLVYPKLVKQNHDVYEKMMELYELQKRDCLEPDSKLTASVILYLMAGEYAFGNHNLGVLNDIKIEWFKNEFGLMFALNLKKLIQKYYNTQSLKQLLKLALKLLDYQHHCKSAKNYKGAQFFLSIFKEYLTIDSFEQINSAIQFLKQNLDRQTFVQYAQMLKNQIGGKAVNQLLSVRVFNSTKQRYFIKIKRDM